MILIEGSWPFVMILIVNCYDLDKGSWPIVMILIEKFVHFAWILLEILTVEHF